MVMRKFFTALVVIPLGVIFVIFAVANRHLVTVSFDPFNSTTPAVAVTLPGAWSVTRTLMTAAR